jgi:hypothetical protein
MTKFCEDCRWAKADSLCPELYMKCRAPQNIKDLKMEAGLNKVTANPSPPDPESRYRWNFCTTHRRSWFLMAFLTGTCGARGRWWQRKEKPTPKERPMGTLEI